MIHSVIVPPESKVRPAGELSSPYPNTCDHPEIRINSLVFLLKKNNYHRVCQSRNSVLDFRETYQPRQCRNNQSLKKIGATLVHPARSCLSTRVTSSQWWAGHPLCLFPLQEASQCDISSAEVSSTQLQSTVGHTFSSWVTWVCQNHLKTDQKSCSMASWKPPTGDCFSYCQSPTWAKACSPDALPFTLQVI